SIGKVIWTNIPGKNVSEIVDLIVGKYNVDRKEVNEDVQEFICELSNKGLIVQKQIGPHENNSFI
ncbi:MAG: PqqD family protein, partial [Thermoplasmata archaeon]|nr:PqqD family protein [Thermoplasmata archaeon]